MFPAVDIRPNPYGGRRVAYDPATDRLRCVVVRQLTRKQANREFPWTDDPSSPFRMLVGRLCKAGVKGCLEPPGVIFVSDHDPKHYHVGGEPTVYATWYDPDFDDSYRRVVVHEEVEPT